MHDSNMMYGNNTMHADARGRSPGARGCVGLVWAVCGPSVGATRGLVPARGVVWA